MVLADHNTTTHLLCWDNVSNGASIYVIYSRYTTAITHADSTWSALGKVNIRPRAAGENYFDFYWEDYTNTTDGLCGYAHSGLATIQLNTHYMDPADDWHEKSCSAHELGHEIAIGDHGVGYSTTALMYGHVGRFISPQQHDKDDYYAKWK